MRSASAWTRSRGEEGLVLKIDVVEMIPVPQFLQSQRHADRFEPHPLALIDERIGAERAAKIATLRGDEIQLPFTFELEVALNRDQIVIVCTEPVDLCQRSRGILPHSAVGLSHGAAQAVVQRLPGGEPLDDLGEGFLALPSHGDIDRWLDQALTRKHRRMPAAPHNGQIRASAASRRAIPERIGDRSAGQHGDAQTQRAVQLRHHGA